MKNSILPINEIQERLEYLKNNPKKPRKIPAITQYITEFVLSEEGKKRVADYMMKQLKKK